MTLQTKSMSPKLKRHERPVPLFKVASPHRRVTGLNRQIKQAQSHGNILASSKKSLPKIDKQENLVGLSEVS